MTKALPVLLIFFVLLVGCPDPAEDEDEEEEIYWWDLEPVTFEDVSQPYRESRGDPEEVKEYSSDNYHSIDWWWWSQGFMVNFLSTTYDEVLGWTVDHTYSFDPI